METYGNKLADYVVDMFTVAMGPSSVYTTLRARTILKRTYADAFEWSNLVFPAILVTRTGITYVNREHGNPAKVLYRRTYKMEAWGIIDGIVQLEIAPTVDTILEAIEEFYERMELVLSTDRFAMSAGGFTTRKATIVYGDVDVIRFADDGIESNRRLGIAKISFDIEAS